MQLDAPVSTPSADSTRGPRGYTILTFDTLSDGIYCAQRVGDRAIVNATIKDLELVACVCFFIYVFGLYAVGDVSVKYGNMDYLLSFFFQLINYFNVFGHWDINIRRVFFSAKAVFFLVGLHFLSFF